MGKFYMELVTVVVLGVVAVCLGDKDPTLSLRPPGSSSPVFSSSIDSIPVSSASSNQQSVYSKRPSTVHSTASASASLGSSSVTQDQSGSGGRHNNPWFSQGAGYEFNGVDSNSAGGSSHTSGSSSTGSGYYEPSPSQTAPSPAPTDSFGGPSQGQHNPSYTYYYQHYPTSNQGSGWSGGEDSGHGGFLGDLSLPGFQLPGLHGGAGGGFGGVGGVKAIAKVIAKGILLVKPFLILGLLLLIAIPVIALLVPLPIITITGQPSVFRSARSSQLATYLTQLSGKVLNAEECLERIICKLPHAPEKYQTKAKLIWDEYGNKMVSNDRVSRGLNAYFETNSQKNKNLKCDQRFKCSNKYL